MDVEALDPQRLAAWREYFEATFSLPMPEYEKAEPLAWAVLCAKLDQLHPHPQGKVKAHAA